MWYIIGVIGGLFVGYVTRNTNEKISDLGYFFGIGSFALIDIILMINTTKTFYMIVYLICALICIVSSIIFLKSFLQKL